MPYGMEYPFGQLGSAVPAVSPPNFLCTPSLLIGGVVREAEKALTAEQQLKQGILNIFLILNQKHSTIPHTRKKITVSQPNPGHGVQL